MLEWLNNSVKSWDWRSQTVWEGEVVIPDLLAKIERWFYQTKEIRLNIEHIDLSTDKFTTNDLFQFLTHYKLVENANLDYPIIMNWKNQIIDWRYR